MAINEIFKSPQKKLYVSGLIIHILLISFINGGGFVLAGEKDNCEIKHELWEEQYKNIIFFKPANPYDCKNIPWSDESKQSYESFKNEYTDWKKCNSMKNVCDIGLPILGVLCGVIIVSIVDGDNKGRGMAAYGDLLGGMAIGGLAGWGISFIVSPKCGSSPADRYGDFKF